MRSEKARKIVGQLRYDACYPSEWSDVGCNVMWSTNGIIMAGYFASLLRVTIAIPIPMTCNMAIRDSCTVWCRTEHWLFVFTAIEEDEPLELLVLSSWTFRRKSNQSSSRTRNSVTLATTLINWVLRSSTRATGAWTLPAIWSASQEHVRRCMAKVREYFRVSRLEMWFAWPVGLPQIALLYIWAWPIAGSFASKLGMPTIKRAAIGKD